MPADTLRLKRFRAFAGAVLAAVLLVILWGAFVRATGSGAGCGSHWPTCNGQVIPRAPSAATVIEFTHRATSGIAFLLVVAQLVWALRLFPRGHLARSASVASMVFMVTEALVGAGLVLFEMVAGNASVARGAWTIVHLANTFLLVGAMTLAWWAAAPHAPPTVLSLRGAPTRLALVGLAGLLFVGMSGAIAALGDTLFPARSLAEGFRDDLSPTAHLFVRLRVLHPIIAGAVALYLLAVAASFASRDEPRGVRARARAAWLAIFVLAQVGIGLLNLALLAPTWLQLVHLAAADFVWIALVLLTADLATAAVPARASAVAASV